MNINDFFKAFARVKKYRLVSGHSGRLKGGFVLNIGVLYLSMEKDGLGLSR